MARELTVKIVGDASSLERALGRAQRSTSGFERGIGKAGMVAGAALAGAAVGAAALGAKMVGLASDAAEVESKLGVVFGGELPKLKRNLDAFADATGASSYKLREQAADMGALLGPLTSSRGEAAKMSAQFVKLATDLGSFNNVPVDDALLAIRSGLIGEAEPLRRFGVLLSAAAVNSEGLRLGLIKQGETMTEQEKVQARASLIMQQTALAQGDAERTAGSMSNQMKALRNNVSDAATSIGVLLIPYALRAVAAFNEHWPTIERVARIAIEGTIAVIRAIAPVVQAVAQAIGRAAGYIREHWEEIRGAAASVAAWYRSNLQPTIAAVVTFLSGLWERFGGTITRVARTTFGAALTVIQTTLANIRSVIVGVLALIRGDWGTAWNELKAVVSRTVSAVAGILRSFVSTAAGIAADIGAAIVNGITSYLASKAGALKDAAKRYIVDPIKSIVPGWGSTPDEWASYAIGKPILAGIVQGLASRNMTEPMRAKVGEMIRGASEGLDSARSTWGTAWGNYMQAALGAFDEHAARFRTKHEKLLDDLQARQERKRITGAVSEARAGLAEAQAGGDPEAIIAAQKALDDALYAQREYGYRLKAEQERRKQDEADAVARIRFEKRLVALGGELARESEKQRVGHAEIVRRIRAAAPDYLNAGKLLGDNIAIGLRDARGGVIDAANELAAAIARALSVGTNAAKLAADKSANASKGAAGARQAGGPVAAGYAYRVGEAGPELFVPTVGGTIVPSAAARRVTEASSVGGGGPIVIPITLTLDGRTVFETVRTVGQNQARHLVETTVVPAGRLGLA